MGALAARMSIRQSWNFAELPGLVPVSVAGHSGKLHFGSWGGQNVLVFSGRVHYYEGHGWDAVCAPVQLAADLGCRTLILTSAAGGIRPDLEPGTLLCLFHHLKWTQPRWWTRGIQKNDPIWYSYLLNDKLLALASQRGIPLQQGLYGCLTGPSYETPAEIRALRTLGVDAVGMSTAVEAEAAYRLGLQTMAISCITNRAAGLSPTPPQHQEVVRVSGKMVESLGNLLEVFLENQH
jgi:purine-nucleoside phosphorylase